MNVPDHIREAVRGVIAGSAARSIESALLDSQQMDRDPGKALTDLAEAAMCFTNARGGHLVVGVAVTRRRVDSGPRDEPSQTSTIGSVIRRRGCLDWVGDVETR